MILKGKVFKYGDNINTDLIISGRYKFSISDANELAKHVLEDLDNSFAKKIIPNKTFIVAGENFGAGSSREQAPIAIQAAKINAVIAKSFARIFYRNSFNIGLPLIECDTEQIKNGDELEIDLDSGTLKNLTKKTEIKFKPFSIIMKKLIEDRGLVNHFKKHRGLDLGI